MAKTLLLHGIKCQKQMWPCFCRGSTYQNLNNCDFASAGSWKLKNGQDLASGGDQVPKQMWPCFFRGSTYQNLNDCDFASAGSRKIKNGQNLASAGDQVPKINVTLLLQGVNISKLKSGDNFSLDLVLEDHETTFFLLKKFNYDLFLNECMFECMRIYDLPLLWMHIWMYDAFFNVLNASVNAWCIF